MVSLANGISPLLNVSSLDKSIEWYKGLGLKTTRGSESGMEWGTVVSGPGVLMLFPKDKIVDGQPADTSAWLQGELGKGVLLTIGVPNARKTWEKAQAMRASVDVPLQEEPWGGWSFHLVDPDGYVIGFADKFPSATPKKARAKKAAKKPAKKGPAKKR